MYRPKPEVAAGFTAEDYETGPIEVWPENLPTVNAFIALGTQWRSGMTGPTGLDYSAIPVVLRLTAVPRSAWGEMFHDLRLMEEAALRAMRGDEKDD